jgi:hypothetical protein
MRRLVALLLHTDHVHRQSSRLGRVRALRADVMHVRQGMAQQTPRRGGAGRERAREPTRREEAGARLSDGAKARDRSRGKRGHGTRHAAGPAGSSICARGREGPHQEEQGHGKQYQQNLFAGRHCALPCFDGQKSQPTRSRFLGIDAAISPAPQHRQAMRPRLQAVWRPQAARLTMSRPLYKPVVSEDLGRWWSYRYWVERRLIFCTATLSKEIVTHCLNPKKIVMGLKTVRFITHLKNLCGDAVLRNRWHRYEGGLEAQTQGGPQDAYPRAPMRAGAAWPCPRRRPTPRVSSSPLCAAPDAAHAACTLTDGRGVHSCLPHGAAASPLRRAAAQLACMFSARPACRGPPRA